MTSNTKVELYIADSLEELNKRVNENPSIEKTKSSNCARITDVIEGTWREAKKAEITHDEERAYILYMRLFACFTALKQAKDVTANQSSVQYYQKGAEIWIEKATQLVESLKARYDVKNTAKIEEERKIQAEIDEENSLGTSISPKLLYKYLNERKKNILLIDMRLKSDYDQSHMRSPACIHISPDLMNGKGWTSWGVESALTDAEALRQFKDRAKFDYIVLFDDGSYETDLKPGNSLMGLKQAIFTLDPDVKLKREPLIIQGGYEDWMVFYPGLSTGPLVSKKTNGQLPSFEVSYPEDVIIAQEVPSDAATVAQPEAALISPAVVPQIDRTRKPMVNPKPESPILDKQELPSTAVEDVQPTIITKEQPGMPSRLIKPTTPAGPSPSVSEEIVNVPILPDIPPRLSPIIPTNPIIPSLPKVSDTPANKKDSNQENIPPKDIPKLTIPNRDALSIYRPFNRTAPIAETNKQYQKKFDAVTGRKIILDTKSNQYITNIPESEASKPPSQPVPTVNRDIKPLLTEQARRQIARDYGAVAQPLQVNRRTGLKNLGNSCYMNSIIQSLAFNFILTNYFLSGEFQKKINLKNQFGSGGAVVREWFNLNAVLWAQQYSYLVPQPFKTTVGRLQQAYLGTQQQDAHEFLVFLLDALHEDLNETTRPRIEELKSENYPDDHKLAEATKEAFRLHNKSIIIDHFYGLFKSTTICRLCSYESIRFEAFAIISVPIPPIRQCSLDSCLELFREFEHLRGVECYACSKCKRISEKNRRLDIWELPKIFIVHFKRFRLQQNHYIKNETLIRYPVSHVNFSRWTQKSSSSTYSLVSVVNHFGSMNSGHYTSYCNDGKQWYYCDDQSIRTADARELEQNVHAYLLFYSSIPQPQLRLPLILN